VAHDASTLPEPQRRQATAGVIRERTRQSIEDAMRNVIPDPGITVEEAIAAVGYPTADHYWRAWLYAPPPREELLTRLVEPQAVNEADFQRRTWKLRTLLEQCPEKETIAALQWLAGHPDAPLHPSFVAYLAQPAPPDAAPAARLPTPEELVAQWTGPFNRLWKRVKADPLRPQCA
jgi:hypothetical protein